MSVQASAPSRRFEAADIAYVAVFAALIAALSLTPSIPLGALGVPITLQTLGVALAGLLLGPWRGCAAVGLYLLVGAAGLPVFAQGSAGIGVFFGATGGYLLAFPLAALVSGAIARWALRHGMQRWTGLWLFAGLLVTRYLVILPLGVAGLVRALGLSWREAIVVDMAFWIGDAVKGVIATVLALAVHRAFPRLMRRD
ncbi:MAG: biotin transporter BioY [Arachnia sp.]